MRHSFLILTMILFSGKAPCAMENTRFPCTFKKCTKTFSRKGNLQQHIRIVHEKKLYGSCFYCRKVFGRKYDLYRHIEVVHRKRKNFVCTECNKTFGLKGNCKTHINRYHNFSSSRTELQMPFENSSSILEELDKFFDQDPLRKELAEVVGLLTTTNIPEELDNLFSHEKYSPNTAENQEGAEQNRSHDSQ